MACSTQSQHSDISVLLPSEPSTSHFFLLLGEVFVGESRNQSSMEMQHQLLNVCSFWEKWKEADEQRTSVKQSLFFRYAPCLSAKNDHTIFLDSEHAVESCYKSSSSSCHLLLLLFQSILLSAGVELVILLRHSADVGSWKRSSDAYGRHNLIILLMFYWSFC